MAILCQCRHVSEKTISEAVADGAGNIEQIGARCGAGTDCGGCHPWIDELLAGSVRTRAMGLSSSA
ncbi:MAG: bacterioferritin-associated ferredoxin [Acidimicrobiia bacterium]